MRISLHPSPLRSVCHLAPILPLDFLSTLQAVWAPHLAGSPDGGFDEVQRLEGCVHVCS